MNAFDRMSLLMQKQSQKIVTDNSKVLLEFGIITEELGLKIARFDVEIPKSEYYIDKRLSIDYDSKKTVTTSSKNGHTHSVDIPLTDGIAKIKSGDMVLVCWVDNDPIIVSVLTGSENM